MIRPIHRTGRSSRGGRVSGCVFEMPRHYTGRGRVWLPSAGAPSSRDAADPACLGGDARLRAGGRRSAGGTETASTATDATGAPDPTGGSGTGGQSSTTGSSGAPEPTTVGTTATSSGDEPTSGTSSPDPGGDPGVSCQQFCDRLTACELDGAFDGCPCQPELLSGAQCLQRWQLAAKCFEIDTCRSLQSGESPCWNDYLAAMEWCLFGEDGCELFHEFGEDTPPDGCVYVDESSRRRAAASCATRPSAAARSTACRSGRARPRACATTSSWPRRASTPAVAAERVARPRGLP